jgi:FG-GAP-like repeat/IPT/TIG domain/Secretion system C-terminal sorting domain/Fibronectin type III domain/FG-GAP repeat
MPPAAPVNLGVSTITTSSFVSFWSLSSGASGYLLDVSSSPSFSSGNILTDFFISGGSTTSKLITGLAPGTAYFFRLRATNAFGPSGNSQVFSVTTLPPAPLNLGANSITEASFVATWSSVQSATAYGLDVSSSPEFSSGNIFTDFKVATSNKLVTGLVAGTIYFVRVRAVNNSGTSGNSQVFSLITARTLAPVITSFTPTSGPVGTIVTITGANFNNTRVNNNFVFFGATQATVTASTSTSLSVIVPFGATFEPISVTDTTTHLTGYSASPFITTFSPAGQTLNSSSFGPKVKLQTGVFSFIKTADFNGDGKPDLLTKSEVLATSKLMIFLNISLRGTLDPTSFAPPIELATGRLSSNRLIAIDDLNGDGRLDIIAGFDDDISVFFNVAPQGTTPLIFTRVDFDAGNSLMTSLATGDLDIDGKPDLAVTKIVFDPSAHWIVTIFHNNYAGGIANTFASEGVSLPAGNFPTSIAIGDLDNDLKPELVVGDVVDNIVSVFTNMTTPGNIVSSSFGAKIDFATGEIVSNVVIGDLDGNGRQDLAVAGSDFTSVFDNIGSSGTFTSASLASRVDYSAPEPTFRYAMDIGDLNGDAKPDLIVNGSILRNTSTAGNGRSSFAQHFNYLSDLGTRVREVAAGDLDGDGKPDLIIASEHPSETGSNEFEISLLHNNLLSDNIPNVFVTSPAHGSTGFLPTVDVTASAGASTYTIQLSPEQKFLTPNVLEKSGARGQRFTGLLYGTTYFARVKTNLSPNFGRTTSFSTVRAEELAFVTSPVDGAVDQSPNLTVASNTVPGATQYTIELNTSSLFDGVSVVKTGNRTQSFTGLSYNTTYYSRVRTEFTQNLGATRSFTIADASKFTFITSPAEGATGLPTTLDLICSQVPGATQFTVNITANGLPSLVFSSTTRTVRASGLSPNTLYTVTVKTNLSDLSGPARTFTTGAALGALAAYPNPASSHVTIKNIKPGSQVKIVDSSGTTQEVIDAAGEELTIDTTKYKKGLYYIILVNSDGSENEGLRLMVN